MRGFRLLTVLAVLAGSCCTIAMAAHVSGYTRKDGTYVAPYERKSSGSRSSSSSASNGRSFTPSAPTPARSYRRDSRVYEPKANPKPAAVMYRVHSSNWSSSSSYAVARDDHGKIIRSESARRAFMTASGYPHGRPGYVVDHIIALKRGGADDPSNMQWQTIADGKAKDKRE